mgnify:CR=1 FL=1
MSEEADPGSVKAMRDLLDRLKTNLGPDWAKDLARDMLDEAEREQLLEALTRMKNA